MGGGSGGGGGGPEVAGGAAEGAGGFCDFGVGGFLFDFGCGFGCGGGFARLLGWRFGAHGGGGGFLK